MSALILSVPMFVWLAISIIFTVAGEFLSKEFANNHTVLFATLAVLAYTIGAVTWLPVIFDRNRVAEMGSAWLLLTLVGTVIVGVALFGEVLNTYEIIGVCLAIAALILLAF